MDSLEVTPALVVLLDAAPLDDDQLLALSEVRASYMLGVPGQCELRFSNPSPELSTSVAGWVGKPLNVAVRSADAELFEGRVTAVELRHGPSGELDFWVRAYDALHALRRSQTVRMHVDATVVELAASIAAPHGLRVRGAEPGPRVRERGQVRESDLAFVDRVAREAGLYLSMRAGELVLLTLEGEGEPFVFGLGKELIETHVEWNAEVACEEAESHGWSPGYARSSSATVRSARGADPAVSETGGEGAVGCPTSVVTECATDDVGHALAVAQAELDRRACASLTVWARTEGEPKLRPGSRVEFSGHPAPGPHVATEVRHVIDAETGFTTEFDTTPPSAPPRRAGTILTLGRVTQVDDSDRLARVKAELVAYAGIETGWMPVVSPGAGAGRGFLFLPDVGDDVAVLLAHEDAAEGVVVGGLYGEEAPPDPGVAGARIRRSTWQSANEQRIQLDDEAGIARIDVERFQLDVRSGTQLGFDENSAHLRAATNLVIEAPGKTILFRAKRVEFEEARGS